MLAGVGEDQGSGGRIILTCCGFTGKGEAVAAVAGNRSSSRQRNRVGVKRRIRSSIYCPMSSVPEGGNRIKL